MPAYDVARANMVENQVRPNKVTDDRVLNAMAAVPRERFVPKKFAGIAYVDEDIAVSKGRYLMVGYRDIYKSGARLITNPTRWHVVPKYGSISWLLRYDIGRDGMPRIAELKQEAGANGKGLRLSPDGRRVTYLSHVGYPRMSYNLAGWDPTDMKKIPVSYAVKGKGTSYDLAFHPVLPIVASPGSGSAVFFDRETGQELKDQLQLDAGEFEQEKINSIRFSPDGRNLIFSTTVKEVPYLHRVALNLSAAERRKVGRGRPVSAPIADPAADALVTIPLKHLDGVVARPQKAAMSIKEIGRRYMDAVVVVRTKGGSGTGLVIGSSGYILTCDHVIDGGDVVNIAYRVTDKGKTRTLTSRAKVLRRDRDKDLALLKIVPASPLVTALLSPHTKIEAGERVTVIGNPGVGKTVLSHTMTEGIVSNPRRTIRGGTFIQTSAAVNPGSSGGPMFDSHGNVIGLVVLKADIEGTGFAVSLDDISAFLKASVTINNALVSKPKLRTWTSASGSYKITARLIRISGNVLHLKGEDGRTFDVPLEKLSAADRQFVRKLSK
ncbi:MAG: trypsin-like peptidase domain-containing protein [Planctomycetes bacterium]|nr:trypsin-like peptidase domain-containing protein [Planctomycetota bacterium]